nr:restriction endonuclease subunit S [uncultured Anaerocolumna sp.]
MANTPNIRFKGFTDDWEQRKWSDTVDISTEMVDPKTGEYDDLPHIAPGNIESFTGRIYDNVKTVKKENLISGKFRFRPNDIIYGKINPQLAKYAYADTDGLTSADAYVLNSKNGITQKFLYAVLQTKDFYKYTVSVSKRSGIPKINRDELKAYDFMAPLEEEQTRIGEYLLSFDNLIILHQRKCDETKELKKYMLQKMFPKDGEKIPEIRFEGFTDDWEQRKLGEIADRVVRKNTNLESALPLTISAQYGLVNQIKYFNKRVASRDVSNYYLMKKGEFAYNKSYSEGYPFGVIKRLDAYEMGALSTLYIIFAPREDIINSDYLVSYYDTNNWHKQVEKRAAEGARNHGLLNISVGDFLDTELKFPKEKDEQAKIGEFFSNLDNLITLHQRKCDQLKEVKKYMLQNMFPQKG